MHTHTHDIDQDIIDGDDLEHSQAVTRYLIDVNRRERKRALQQARRLARRRRYLTLDI